MTNFSDEFVSLQCPHCTGAVKITPVQLDESFVEHGDTFVYIGNVGNEQIKCQHCGTEFVRKQRLSVAVDGAGTINTGGGAFFGGNVIVNGDFVGRDSIHVNVGSGSRNVAVGRNIVQSTIVTGDNVTVIRNRG